MRQWLVFAFGWEDRDVLGSCGGLMLTLQMSVPTAGAQIHSRDLHAISRGLEWSRDLYALEVARDDAREISCQHVRTRRCNSCASIVSIQLICVFSSRSDSTLRLYNIN